MILKFYLIFIKSDKIIPKNGKPKTLPCFCSGIAARSAFVSPPPNNHHHYLT